MLLKTGSLALLLLLTSRLTGLWRESAQAAAFGATGMGDVAILMLTFPDWLTGMLASGALAYVLLPHWAGQTPAQRAQSQARVGRWLVVISLCVALLVALLRQPLVHLLAGGLTVGWQPAAELGMIWSAVALPAAFLSALWITRLQQEQDFVGMYSANLVVNGVLIAALYLMAGTAMSANSTAWLGVALCAAMGLRLLWVRWRLRPVAMPLSRNSETRHAPLPAPPVWLWATLSAGLPLTLPLAARSFASIEGPGALSTFNYAWKLVELPLALGIQLVATLAFPSISRAFAGGANERQVFSDEARQVVRGALVLAWTLACAAVAALQVGAPAIAALLFGWGRMPTERLDDIALWGAIGAWGLLPQALIAVALTVLAAQGRMRLAVVAYATALVAIGILGAWGNQDGAGLMWYMNCVLTGVALFMVFVLHQKPTHPHHNVSLIPWKALGIPVMVLLGLDLSQRYGWAPHGVVSQRSGLWLCISAAFFVLMISYACSREFRLSLRR